MKVAALSGGVGGAKLALGLNENIGSDDLTLIANTGDDFQYHGLNISPDIDTLVYTLSGKSDETRGWGLADESWAFMGALGEYSGETWFNLGDKDLAMHVIRTDLLRQGARLGEVTDTLRRSLGVAARILPMTDRIVPTVVDTVEHGLLPFQSYFVEHQAKPTVRGFIFKGVEHARPAPGVLGVLAAADRVVICPSNPFISIDPILAVPGIRDGLRETQAPVIAVSPIVAGAAIKGPTAKMFAEMGESPSALAIAKRYQDVIDLIVIDEQDQALIGEIEALGLGVVATNTIMHGLEEKKALANIVLTVPVPAS